MDYRLIALAITNGDFSQEKIALAIQAIKYLKAPEDEVFSVTDFLLAMSRT
jgi:hypothetical protein